MFRAIVTASIWLGGLAAPAAAQSDYPSRPVRIVVPSSPGGGTDILARVLAEHLARSLGGQFFVENRPGAGQMIGIESVARAAPDGYTLLMAASTLAINVRQRLADDGAEAAGTTPNEFATLIKEELAKWSKVARDAPIQPQ